MRKTVIAGNWKMNMTPTQTKSFIEELAPMVKGKDLPGVSCLMDK